MSTRAAGIHHLVPAPCGAGGRLWDVRVFGHEGKHWLSRHAAKLWTSEYPLIERRSACSKSTSSK